MSDVRGLMTEKLEQVLRAPPGIFAICSAPRFRGCILEKHPEPEVHIVLEQDRARDTDMPHYW
jgi:hypothetical protein